MTTEHDVSSSHPITAATRFVGVIGEPVDHSLSPVLHNAAYEALGLDLCYGAFPVGPNDARAALVGARALGFVGLSVTTPHKERAAYFSDQRSPVVERLGVANSVVFRSGISFAYSTDGEGLIADLETNCGFSPRGMRCAVIGAGGAARAVILALAEAGAHAVLVVNRTPERAESAAELAGSAGLVGEPDGLANAELVINATSLGLSAPGSDAAADREATRLGSMCSAAQLVVDLSYRYQKSTFLVAAEASGATVRNGLGMLVHQAARQVELFTDTEAPLEAMWAAVASYSTGSL